MVDARNGSSGRIRTIDGVRAFSIVFVLMGHAFGTGIVPMNVRLSHLAGDLGVRTFFVLSGFLITTLLVREHRRHGNISLVNFYMRRALRIFPAFYVFLVVVAMLAAIGVTTLGEGDLFAAATYTMNFQSERTWATGHLWSLAVEEQFYLVWPLTIVFLGLARAWSFAIGAIILAPIVRVLLWYSTPEYRPLVDQAFPCVFDALATGCLLGLARDRLARSAFLDRLFDARWFWAIPIVSIGAMVVQRPWFHYGPAMSCANLAIALVLLRCVSRPDGAVGRLLERPSLVWLGTLSYSLYLWQQLFINRHADGALNQFPLNVAAALCAAVACHYLIERPILRLAAPWRDRPVLVDMPALLPQHPMVVEIPARAGRSRRAPTTATLAAITHGDSATK